MQSGTIGINTTRVYNPIKQAQDHDPRGIFVRRWLPNLKKVPDAWIFEPWKMASDLEHGMGAKEKFQSYNPIVDLSSATRTAKERVHARRKQDEVRIANKEVIEKHASRKPLRRKTKRISDPSNAPQQLGFNFE